MLRKLRMGLELGGNLRTFDHFQTVATRHLKPNEKHLNICKKGIMTFAQALSMQFDRALIDYTEFAGEGSGLFLPIRRIQPNIPEGETPEKVVYDSVSLFLTLHDYPDYAEKLKGLYYFLPKGGRVFVVDYNFEPWIHSLPKPRKVFARWFSVRNEKIALRDEPDCFERHTSLSLDDIAQEARDAGFETLHAEAYAIQHPKFCLYIGRK
ncbi:MAG: hypothetical protein KKE50_03275 [Nanoarchaeota archaeon]|nr:hypothetical protein [Nanoarchaeota archaeon]